MKFFVVITDAFGGRGGIAKFNRDFLTTMCSHPEVEEVVALPRLLPDEPGVLPKSLVYNTEGVGHKGRYIRTVLSSGLGRGKIDGVICGHINLLPLAYLAAKWKRAPLILIIHGVDAWVPTRSRMSNWLAARIDAVVAVSHFTRQRFLKWAKVSSEKAFVIPNCIDAVPFGPGAKSTRLLARYGLEGRKVIMTLGRMSASERYKGFDEVLEVLPVLSNEIPNLAYVIVGDGDDRERLERKAATLGVEERVVFTGYIAEEEKAEHYRMADAFVMPGRGEGFGIVYLEALACGIPVVASCLDASKEAVLGGKLGEIVNPDDKQDLIRGILGALEQGRGDVPTLLEYFSESEFQKRWHGVIGTIMPEKQSTPGLVAA